MAKQRIPGATQLNAQVPAAMKKEIEMLAAHYDQSLGGIVRLALRAGLPLLGATANGLAANPDPHEVNQ